MNNLPKEVKGKRDLLYWAEKIKHNFDQKTREIEVNVARFMGLLFRIGLIIRIYPVNGIPL